MFLLVDSYKDGISNVTLNKNTTAGVIETYNEIKSGKPYELRWDTPTIDVTGGTNIAFPSCVKSRSQLGSMFDTINNWFRFPVSGVYRFEFSITLAGVT